MAIPNKTKERKGIVAKKTIASCQEMVEAIIRANIIMKGALMTIRIIICKEFWTLVTSVVMRVMSDEVEKWSIFLKEKSWIW